MMHFGVRSAMLPGSIRCWAFASLLFALTTAALRNVRLLHFGIHDRQVASREYNLWLEVDRIARMPDPQRATQIPHVYRDIFADLHRRWYALDNWMILPVGLDGYRESKTPEQWVKVGIQPGYPNMFSPGIAVHDEAILTLRVTNVYKNVSISIEWTSIDSESRIAVVANGKERRMDGKSVASTRQTRFRIQRRLNPTKEMI